MAHLVDGATMSSKAHAMAAIAGALSFPGYFGANLDALYDCLTDLSWLPTGEHVLIWSAPNVLATADPAAYQGIHKVLADAATHRPTERPLTVILAAS